MVGVGIVLLVDPSIDAVFIVQQSRSWSRANQSETWRVFGSHDCVGILERSNWGGNRVLGYPFAVGCGVFAVVDKILSERRVNGESRTSTWCQTAYFRTRTIIQDTIVISPWKCSVQLRAHHCGTTYNHHEDIKHNLLPRCQGGEIDCGKPRHSHRRVAQEQRINVADTKSTIACIENPRRYQRNNRERE